MDEFLIDPEDVVLFIDHDEEDYGQDDAEYKEYDK